jgi:outer membrane lipoprotein-sorting protein
MRLKSFLTSLAVLAMLAPPSAAQDARDIVRSAWEHWRGTSSQGEMTMTIHRPSWERSMSMRTWTRGQKHSLVRVTAPKKDAGNGTLIVENNMWTYSPKVNRVIKVPSSMMGQSWMGSDFSNKDVSKADDIVDQYDHTLLAEEEHDGHKVWVIESVPHEDAAVVWGKEVLRVRDDHVLVKQEFYDQDGALVKSMISLEIAEMGGRVIATRQRMQKTDAEEEWTEILVDSSQFDVEIKDSLFTLSNLRNPRE